MTLQEKVWENWKDGWASMNLPTSSLVYPRDAGVNQVLDSRGLEFTPGGVLRWVRNQYMITAPAGASIHETTTAMEFFTGTYNQLVAIADYGAAPPYKSYLYYQNTNWTTALAAPTQWTYGYELFHSGSWTQVVPTVDLYGVSDAIQVGNVLILADYATSGGPLRRWNGATLAEIGIAAPPSAPFATSTTVDLTVGGPPGCTETDTGNYLTVNATTCSFAAMPESSHSALCYNSNVAETFAEFRHNFDVNLTSMADGGIVAAWGVSNQADVPVAHWTDGIWVLINRSGAKYYLTLGGRGATTTDHEISAGTTYYCTLSRFPARNGERTTYLTVCSDAARTVALFGIHITGADVAFQYVYLGTGSGGVGTAVATGLVQNLNLSGGAPVGSGGHLSAGKYSYYYTWGNAEFESMHSPIWDVTTVASDSIILTGIGVGPVGTTWRKLYRAYTTGTGLDERGDTFYYVTILGDNTTTTFTDTISNDAVGFAIEFDHALPPWGWILEWHKDRAYLAGVQVASKSYDDWETDTAGYWANTLFYSELDEPYYWPGENMIRVGDDVPITDLVSWGDTLLIFKRNQIWQLSGYDNEDFVLSQLTARHGSAGLNSVCASPAGILWSGADGYYFYDGAQIRKVLDCSDLSPWSPIATGLAARTITYLNGKFYVRQTDYLLTWDVENNRWTYRSVGASGMGFMRSYAYDLTQSHVLCYMKWVTDGTKYLTVLDCANKPTNRNAVGSSYGDLFAPVRVTLPPLIAAPGQEIVPVEVWVDGSWTDVTGKTPTLYLNDDADYSSTAGQNAWATTPDCPKSNKAIGVPHGYSYTGPTYKTNAFQTLYVQIYAASAPAFVLNAVRMKYYLRQAKGA